MHQLVVVGVLQGISDLADVGEDDIGRKLDPFRVSLPQGAIGRIFHHQEGCAVGGHIKVEDGHNMRMDEIGDGLGFPLKALYLIACQFGLQHFNGCPGLETQMLTEVDFGKATLPWQLEEAVVPQLLAYPVFRYSSTPN